MEPRSFWANIFNAKGRAGRGAYWAVTGLVAALYLGCGLLMIVLGRIGLFAALALLIVAAVLSVFISIRRLHDLGRSGWWLLGIILIDLPVAMLAQGPTDNGLTLMAALLQFVVAIAYAIVFGVLPGQKGPNRFGPPPGQGFIAEPLEQAA